MGQPHQAYLIARVLKNNDEDDSDEPQYICVAAIYLDSCHGVKALTSLHRFVTLVKQPDNAEIIREELRAIGESEWRFKSILSDYLSRLLSCAHSFGYDERPCLLSEGNSFDSGALDVGTEPWESACEDLSIIDVTDPENPSYCFVHFETWITENVLLDARQYAQAVYGDGIEESDQRKLEKSTSPLDSLPCLNPDALHEVWPYQFAQMTTYKSGSPDRRINNDTAYKPMKPSIPTLAELLLVPAIKHVLDTDDHVGIQNLFMLPGKANSVLEALRSPEFVSSPEILMKFLNEMTEQDSGLQTVDLSYFTLPRKDILFIVHRLPQTQVLKLSHNSSVTVDVVQSILEVMPNLRRLVLLNTPINETELAHLFRNRPELFYNLDALVHPSLLQLTRVCNFPALTFSRGGGYIASMPFFSNRYLVQVLTTFMDALTKTHVQGVHGVLSAETLRPGLTWEERNISLFARSRPKGVTEPAGWIFLLVSSRTGQLSRYGFIKPRRDPEVQEPKDRTSKKQATGDETPFANAFSVYDVHGFLEELEKEGRPPLAKDDFNTLTQLFNAPVIKNWMGGEQHRLELITHEEAKKFILPSSKRENCWGYDSDDDHL